MSYTTDEKNEAILAIGQGRTDFTNIKLYEDLEKFNWIHISWLKGHIDAVELTYSGINLYKRLALTR